MPSRGRHVSQSWCQAEEGRHAALQKAQRRHSEPRSSPCRWVYPSTRSQSPFLKSRTTGGIHGASGAHETEGTLSPRAPAHTSMMFSNDLASGCGSNYASRQNSMSVVYQFQWDGANEFTAAAREPQPGMPSPEWPTGRLSIYRFLAFWTANQSMHSCSSAEVITFVIPGAEIPKHSSVMRTRSRTSAGHPSSVSSSASQALGRRRATSSMT